MNWTARLLYVSVVSSKTVLFNGVLVTSCLNIFCDYYYVLVSGGYVSNSLAIMTDALHILADVVGILFSMLALFLTTKPPTKRFTFGLHRLGMFSFLL